MTRLSFALIFLLLCSVGRTQTYSWKSLSMGGAGFVSGIITSKQQQNLMYARTDVGGAYKWNAATGSWTQLLDWVSATQSGFYGVESIAIDPQAANKVYMYVGINYFDGGKSAILKSDDYGQTFTTIDVTSQFKAHGNGAGRSNGERLQVDPNLGSVLYVGTRANGLWKSADYGATWNRLTGLNVTTTPNGAGVSFVLIDPGSGTPGNASQIIYAGISRYGTEGENFYKSTDGGVTFTPVAGGPASFMPQKAVQTTAGDLVINYANGSGPSGGTFGTSVESMNNGGIYKYNMSGGTWANITPSGISRAWGGLTVDPNNALRMMASTINNYQLQYATPGPPGTGAYGDRIYLTTNGGATWRDVVNPGFSLNTNGAPWIYGQAIHWAGSLEFDPFNTSKVYVTSGNGVFSNDNIDVVGNPWKFEVKGLEETVPTAIVSLPGGPLFTTIADYDGFSYTDLNAYGTRLTPTMGTTTGLAYAGNNPNFLVRVGSRMYYSTDQGTSWIQTTAINGSQGKVAVTADGSTLLHCPNGSTTIYYSTNNGASWTGALNGAGPALFSLSNAIPIADMVNPSKIYLYNNGSGNFSISTNGGASFSVVQGIGANGSKLMRTIPGKEGHIWVALYGGGLKRSINSGTTFTTIAGVTACSAIGYGKAAPGAAYLTLYIWGTVSGATGLFRSTDEGATWVRVNDDAHQFGGPGNAQAVMGDMNVYGIVYMTTVGRGVIAGWDAATGPLPVSLGGFSVKAVPVGASTMARLNWKTLSENNTRYFDIERSMDGINWRTAGTVTARGSSSAAIDYNYSDDITGMSGKLYYRLRIMDKDGHFTYSQIILLPLDRKKDFVVTLAPNPVESGSGPSLFISSGAAIKLNLRLVSATGIIVAGKQVLVQEGSSSISLPEIFGQPAGVYLLQVRQGDGLKVLETIRFIKR